MGPDSPVELGSFKERIWFVIIPSWWSLDLTWTLVNTSGPPCPIAWNECSFEHESETLEAFFERREIGFFAHNRDQQSAWANDTANLHDDSGALWGVFGPSEQIHADHRFKGAIDLAFECFDPSELK